MANDLQKWLDELRRQQGNPMRQSGGASRNSGNETISTGKEWQPVEPVQAPQSEGVSNLDLLLEEARRTREARRAQQSGRIKPVVVEDGREVRRREHQERDQEENRRLKSEKEAFDRKDQGRLTAEHKREIEDRIRAKRKQLQVAETAAADAAGQGQSQPGAASTTNQHYKSGAASLDAQKLVADVKQMLASPRTLREAFVLTEILGQPRHEKW